MVSIGTMSLRPLGLPRISFVQVRGSISIILILLEVLTEGVTPSKWSSCWPLHAILAASYIWSMP